MQGVMIPLDDRLRVAHLILGKFLTVHVDREDRPRPLEYLQVTLGRCGGGNSRTRAQGQQCNGWNRPQKKHDEFPFGKGAVGTLYSDSLLALEHFPILLGRE